MSLEEVRNYLNSIRRDFSSRPLDDNSIKNDPFDQYAIWFEEAVGAQVPDPYAACLSTVDSENKPSSRMVYIRDIIDGSFIFYTNYQSRKGADIALNPYVYLNVYWVELERQIRVQGKIELIDLKISDSYFKNRPRESQIGAWASDQSNILSSRQELMDKYSYFENKYHNKDVPRPPHWGGYKILVDQFEFWQGRPNRLHDRIIYHKEPNKWRIDRLSP